MQKKEQLGGEGVLIALSVNVSINVFYQVFYQKIGHKNRH